MSRREVEKRLLVHWKHSFLLGWEYKHTLLINTLEKNNILRKNFVKILPSAISINILRLIRQCYKNKAYSRSQMSFHFPGVLIGYCCI